MDRWLAISPSLPSDARSATFAGFLFAEGGDFLYTKGEQVQLHNT